MVLDVSEQVQGGKDWVGRDNYGIQGLHVLGKGW